MGTYRVSARPIGNKTVHAQNGVQTYGIEKGTGLTVSRSHAEVYRAKDLRRDYSRFKNTILQAITPP